MGPLLKKNVPMIRVGEKGQCKYPCETGEAEIE